MGSRQIFAYGFLGLPLAFAALPVYVHVPRFYAETADLDLAWLGAILLLARLVDAGIDPWLGWLADRVPRRTMLAWALLPLAAGFVALLNPPAGGAAGWLLASLAVTYLGFSAATVAYQAWGADVAGDSLLRTRLTAAREGFGLLGVVAAAALPTLIAPELDEGIARLGWLFPPLLAIAALTTFAQVGAGRRPAPVERSLAASLRGAFSDRAFRRLLLVFAVNGVAAALPATLFLFFVADVLLAEAASGPLLALYFVAGAVSLPAWVGLARRHGRVAAWLTGMALAGVAFAGAGGLAAGDVIPFALICFASGLALGADLALPAALAADLGERRGQAGACFGLWNFVSKLNLALAAGTALPLLAVLGYAPGAGGSGALTVVYALVPLAFKALAAVLLWRWRHDLEIRT